LSKQSPPSEKPVLPPSANACLPLKFGQPTKAINSLALVLLGSVNS